MRKEDVAVIAEFLLSSEIEKFEATVHQELEKLLDEDKQLVQEDFYFDNYEALLMKLKYNFGDKPFFISVYDEIFDFYLEVVIPERFKLKHNPEK
jgi:hypothetical protein